MDNKLNEQNNFIMYTTDDGQVDIEVRLEDENVWLTQNSTCPSSVVYIIKLFCSFNLLSIMHNSLQSLFSI